MLDLTRKSFDKVKSMLLHQQKKVEADLKAVEKEDVVLNPAGLAESTEPGTDSWMADVHSRSMATRQSLLDLLTRIKKALINIRAGKYGTCDNCGKTIEPARLEAMPTATLCLSCSKKLSKKN